MGWAGRTARPRSTLWRNLADHAEGGIRHLLDLVDRLLLYRAPILIGEGKSALGYIGLTALADAHRRWRFVHSEMLGIDRLEVYEREPSED